MSEKAGKSPARPLDVTRATREVWLVKVPNYLSNMWSKAEPGADLGVMRDASTKERLKVTFTVAPDLIKKEQADIGVEIPAEHKVQMQNTSLQSLSTFSEEVGVADGRGLLAAEGKVNQRADIQPVSSEVYMKLKGHQFRAAGKTKNTAQQLERAPTTLYKPRSQQKEYAEHDRRKKEAGKRAKDDREVVLDLIFSAFQQHEYYNFKDLVQKTQQPVSYLREILKEVCHYSVKAPHRNMWHLKPEYRHYQPKPESD
jgi:transcription initiation factor TFIIF subunit beta